jgi:hypothetical protein
VSLHEPIDDHEARVVAALRVFGTGVAQADDE